MFSKWIPKPNYLNKFQNTRTKFSKTIIWSRRLWRNFVAFCHSGQFHLVNIDHLYLMILESSITMCMHRLLCLWLQFETSRAWVYRIGQTLNTRVLHISNCCYLITRWSWKKDKKKNRKAKCERENGKRIRLYNRMDQSRHLSGKRASSSAVLVLMWF